MGKKKNKCIMCGRKVDDDIRCASCRARSKHFSPSQKVHGRPKKHW